MTNKQERQERMLSGLLADAERLEDRVERGWSRIPTTVFEASVSFSEDEMHTMITEMLRSDTALEELFEGFEVLFRGAFCVGYRVNEALSGGAAPTPWITDEEREAAFEPIIENVFSPRYNQEMRGFLLAYSVGMKVADEKDAHETVLGVYRVGFYLGYEAYEDDDDD